MKALIRNPGETVTEDMGIAGIDWNTGMPAAAPASQDPAADVQDTIVIDGVTYTRMT